MHYSKRTAALRYSFFHLFSHENVSSSPDDESVVRVLAIFQKFCAIDQIETLDLSARMKAVKEL
jgi:hypothetical protein